MAFTEYVSGSTVTGEVVEHGTQTVVAQGVALWSEIGESGTQVVGFQGSAAQTQIDSAGRQIVEFGGVARTVEIAAGGVQTVEFGAVVSDVRIAKGGMLELGSGAAVDLVLQLKGGAIRAGAGDEILRGINRRTDTDGTFTISAGTARNLLLGSGGALAVGARQYAENTSVGIGGTLTVAEWGFARGILQGGAGALVLNTGATADGTNHRRDGKSAFSVSGGTATNLHLISGGALTVQGGGRAVATLLGNGGTLNVRSGGLISGTGISGGAVTLDAGASALNTLLRAGGSLAAAWAESGGGARVVGLGVSGGATAQLDGIASKLEIRSGGVVRIGSGGEVVSAALRSNGVLDLASGASAAKIVQRFGGGLRIDAGVANATGVNSRSGGVSSAFSVLSGRADNVLLEGNGVLKIGAEQSAFSSYLRNGGIELVESGGFAYNTSVGRGGEQRVALGGYADATVIGSTGLLTVDGTTNSAWVGSTGLLDVRSGGAALNTGVLRGGVMRVGADGSARGTTVYSGGTQQVETGALAVNTILNSRALQVVAGSALQTIVGGVGSMRIESTGFGDQLSVRSGGVLTNAGNADNIVASAGGTVILASGGRTEYLAQNAGRLIAHTGHTLVLGADGTRQFSILDGVADNLTLAVGSELYVERGDFANNLTVAGGTLTTAVGGNLTGNLTVAGGTLSVGDSGAFGALEGLVFELAECTAGSPLIAVESGAWSDVPANLEIHLDGVISGVYTLASAGWFGAWQGKTVTVTAAGNEYALAIGSPVFLAEGRKLTLATVANGSGGENLMFRVDCVDMGSPDPATATEVALADTLVSGTLGADDCYRFTLDASGAAELTLAAFGGSVKTTLYSWTGRNPKKLKSISVKSGKTGSLTKYLDAGTYYLKVESTGTAERKYELRLGGGELPVDNSDDDWKTTTRQLRPGDAVTDYVGWGDRYDCFRLNNLEQAANLSFAVSGVENTVKVTVYEITEKSSGKLSRKKLTSLTVSAKAGSGETKALELAAGKTFVAVVESPGYASGKNSEYRLKVNGDWLPCDTSDDTRSGTEKSLQPGGETVVDFVGFGDLVDYRRLELDEAASLDLKLSGLEQNAKVTVYNSSGNAVKSLKVKVSRDKKTGAIVANSGELRELALTAGTYFVAVAAAGKSGARDTAYTLDVAGRTIPVPNSDNANNKATGASRLEENLEFRDYVGYGDSKDYLAFSSDGGTYDFSIRDFTADLKLTLYSCTAAGKSLKRLAVYGLDAAAGDWTLENLSLAAGEYRFLLEPAGDTGERNTWYGATIAG